MAPPFAHLHVHTEYSLLDGLSRISGLVQRCKALGMGALAITDHGALHGVVEFYAECKAAGVKPILGCELYVARSNHRGKNPEEKSPYHLTVLSKDNQGYRNLIKLVTAAHLDGFYYRPRVDRELLSAHSQGLIVLSGCLNGEVARSIQDGRPDLAREVASWYRQAFGGDYYLELQSHQGVPALEGVNRELVAIGKELGIPLVATNDSHYTLREDASLQDILLCIQTNSTVSDPKRLKMDGDSYYVKSPDEMAALFPELPEALANTARIAEQCAVEMEFHKPRLPKYPTPQGTDADSFLASLCWEGLRRRKPDVPPRYQERLRYELEVVQRTHFADYFLVVWDIARFVRERNIRFGVRGSAAASLALYCLGVTDVDPLEYVLVFERFLNLERREMPDIDMDFQDDRRDEVIQYVVQKYGQERVAQIITFGTLGPKAAIRDVGRALGMTYADVDRVARLVPFRAKTLDEAAEMAPELKELWTADQQLQRLLDTAKKLEGVVRHASTHAAGVVISGEPLTEYAPLQQPVRGEGAGISMTQFSMDPIAKLGLLKMDFLGLTNLTILDRAIAIIGRERGVTLDLARVPLDDPPTFRLLSSGETTDLFQLEGAGMRRYIKELKPTSLRDIAAMIALYRPGPMEHIETYIRAKHGLERVRYPHPVLKDVLEETYGVIVYQDQVLFIVRAFAGYSLGEADVIRKAMGKKIPEIMQREKEQFLARAVSKGYSHQDAEAVFSLIEPFAGYAFNKAHSVSYALIAYWTAYLKANYPVEYMCAVLDTRLGNLEKVPTTVAECQRLGVPVLPPDVDHSEVRFTIEAMPQDKRGIRFGLEAIKNVGAAAVAPIVEARRKGGPFRSISDFCGRVDLRGVNRRTLESLIKVGALDSLGDRGALLASVERILSLAQRQAAQREAGQISMFDLFGQAAEAPLPTLELPTSKTSGREKLEWERELLGVPLSENPFSALVAALAGSEAVLSRHQIEPEMAGQKLVLVGQVASVRQGLTREQKPFISASVALMDGAVDVVAWPPVSEETQELWADGSLLWIVGKVRVRDDRLSLVCEEARPYVLPAAPEEVSTPVVTPEGMAKEVPLGQRGAPPVVPAAGRPRSGNGTNGQSEHGSAGTLYLTFQESDDPGADEARLREALKLLLEFPGRDKLYLQVQTTGGQVTLEMPSITVSWSPALQRAVAEQLGGWASLRGGSEERL